MCERVEPHKQSPLHEHAGPCLLSILAFYDPVFLCFYFRYLRDANIWRRASVRHGSSVCFSTSWLCQRGGPACLSGDSQTHNEPGDEALICKKTPPTCPGEWFLRLINYHRKHHSKYHPEWFSALPSYKSSICFATVSQPSRFITLATLHLECLDVVPMIRNWFWADLQKYVYSCSSKRIYSFDPRHNFCLTVLSMFSWA